MSSSELGFTLRSGELGDVARALTRDEVARYGHVARLMLERSFPRLVLADVVVSALRAGRSRERGRAASRMVGSIIEALAALLCMDVRESASRQRIHAALRALEPVGLDALEDLLALYDVARVIIEAERMFRAGLLSEDWALILPPGEQAEEFPVRFQLRAPIRRDGADA